MALPRATGWLAFLWWFVCVRACLVQDLLSHTLSLGGITQSPSLRLFHVGQDEGFHQLLDIGFEQESTEGLLVPCNGENAVNMQLAWATNGQRNQQGSLIVWLPLTPTLSSKCICLDEWVEEHQLGGGKALGSLSLVVCTERLQVNRLHMLGVATGIHHDLLANLHKS